MVMVMSMLSNSLIFDLSNIQAERIFVVGEIRGDYASFIDLLYTQKFNVNDIIIATGNFLHPEKRYSEDLINFFLENDNTFSVKGKSEFDLINDDNKPEWLQDILLDYIEELPLIIKLTDTLYIVNKGIEPRKSIEDQFPDVFYNIDTYDENSRFYQFENPDKKNWYDFEFFNNDKLMKFCFGGWDIPNNITTAGYCLGRDAGKAIKCAIFHNNDFDNPIIIENL